MAMNSSDLYFVYRKTDPASLKGIEGADTNYRGSLTMVRGRKAGYYVATTSEARAKRIVEGMNLDAYVRGDRIEADIWHDFSRNKAICLRSDEEVSDLLKHGSHIDYDEIADWVA